MHAEVTTAACALALPIRTLTTLRPADPRKRGRSLHRAALDDGTLLKVRILESADAVSKLVALRGDLEPAFVPVFAYHGRVLFEPWVEGRLLSLQDSERYVSVAGALLGRLHNSPCPQAPTRMSTERYRRRAARDLAALLDAGCLSPAECDVFDAHLGDRDPGATDVVIVHRDFCPENMLIDHRGALRIFDNELFEWGASGLDLGRTLCRWSLPSVLWEVFLRSYGEYRRLEDLHLPFWFLVSAIWSAQVRLDQPRERLDEPLSILRRILEDPSWLATRSSPV